MLLRMGAAVANPEASGSGRVLEPLRVELFPGDRVRWGAGAGMAEMGRAAPQPQVC